MNIIKIGYVSFLIRRASDAAAVIKALADAVPVESCFRDNREIYYPSKIDRHTGISMHTVQSADIYPSDPGEIDLDDTKTSTARQHGDRPVVRLVKDSPRLLNSGTNG